MTDPTPALRSLCMYAALAIAILTMAKLLGYRRPSSAPASPSSLLSASSARWWVGNQT